jgi:hypothetical protein
LKAAHIINTNPFLTGIITHSKSRKKCDQIIRGKRNSSVLKQTKYGQPHSQKKRKSKSRILPVKWSTMT